MTRVRSDIIQEQAFGALLITCDADSCPNLFADCLSEPATDPVNVWAADMATRARSAGWSTDQVGRVLCPNHLS